MKVLRYNNFKNYHDNIRIFYKEDKNYEGYKLCLELKYAIEKQLIQYSQHDIWVCCINLSSGYRKLNLFKMATYYAKLSLKYAIDNIDFIKSKIMLANCYQQIGKNNKALEMYDYSLFICNKIIKNLNEDIFDEYKNKVLECKANLLYNKGEMLHNKKIIYKSITVYKSLFYNDILKNQIIQNKIKKGYKAIQEIQEPYKNQEIKYHLGIL